jgi:hypothetical protein
MQTHIILLSSRGGAATLETDTVRWSHLTLLVWRGVFLDYEPQPKGYRVLRERDGVILVTRALLFWKNLVYASARRRVTGYHAGTFPLQVHVAQRMTLSTSSAQSGSACNRPEGWNSRLTRPGISSTRKEMLRSKKSKAVHLSRRWSNCI